MVSAQALRRQGLGYVQHLAREGSVLQYSCPSSTKPIPAPAGIPASPAIGCRGGRGPVSSTQPLLTLQWDSRVINRKPSLRNSRRFRGQVTRCRWWSRGRSSGGGGHRIARNGVDLLRRRVERIFHGYRRRLALSKFRWLDVDSGTLSQSCGPTEGNVPMPQELIKESSGMCL